MIHFQLKKGDRPRAFRGGIQAQIQRRDGMNAWYWRHRWEHANDCHWEFLCYGKPDIFWLQREYMEIRS